MSIASNKKWQKYYDYLDELRESGITNMFCARPYLIRAFDLKPEKASEILTTWMKEFSKEQP